MMKPFKKIPTTIIILIFLLLLNLTWTTWNLYRNTFAAGQRFKVEVLHTNGLSGIGIFETKDEQPLWAKWDSHHAGKPNQEEFFFRGKQVFNVTFSDDGPPKYSVYFNGIGKSVTWWLDRGGSGTFTEKIFYDTNGIPSRHEIWYNQAWQIVDRRSGTNGIIVGGQWHPLTFDTNGMWALKTPTNAPAS